MVRATMALIALLVMSSCGGSDSSESVIETRVTERLLATAQIAAAIETGIAESQTATATVLPTSTAEVAATPSPTPTTAPTSTLEPTSTPAAPTATAPAPDPPPPPPPAAPQESPADQLAQQGYYPFDRPELAIMIHPRLSLDDPADETPPGEVEYIFTDFQAEYIFFELSVYMDYGAKRSISDAEIRAFIDGTVRNTSHISSHEIIATDPTSIAEHPGRIGRFNFVTNGNNAYGVVMLFSHGEWLYRFDIYGTDAEYAFIEEIVSSIFKSAYMRGPGNAAHVNVSAAMQNV